MNKIYKSYLLESENNSKPTNKSYYKCSTTISNLKENNSLMNLDEDEEMDQSLIPTKQKSLLTKF